MRTRSPFPGMDPWLESYCGDIHTRLITNFADQIQDQLPVGLYAEIEVTVYISDESGDRTTPIPDVAVLGDRVPWSEHASGNDASNTVVANPFLVRISNEPVERGHIVIKSLEDHDSVITVIEVLSPTNKIDRRGRRAYFDKREDYYRSGASLVEIDLLRAGADLVDVPFDEFPEHLLTPYKAVVRRAFPLSRTQAEYYALPLRQALSRIAIPLRRIDTDVVLDLQLAIDEAYKRGRYGTRLDYGKSPRPSLSTDDAAWAAELISKSV
jgi:hypothetical protein